MKKILIVAAENSAETYAAQVVEEFKKNNSDAQFFGVGGDKLNQLNVELLFHNRELAVVGIIEVVSHIFKLKRCMNALLKAAIDRRADAALLIDYPDFNLRLAEKLKKAGIRVYYYIGPTVWAWRYSRVKVIKKVVDHIFIIFPFEVPIYQKENIPFTYTGHPLIPQVKINRTRHELRKKWDIPGNEILVSLLPGSRKSEILFLLPNMLAAMLRLSKEFKLHVFLLKAENIENNMLSSMLEKTSLPVRVIPQDQGYDLINASDAVLTTCGTSNLEIAMIGIPFTAVYRVNRYSYLLGKRFVKIDLYSIVNILAGKEVVRELIQENYTIDNICSEIRRLLTKPDERKIMLENFCKVKSLLAQDQNPPGIIHKKIISDFNNSKMS